MKKVISTVAGYVGWSNRLLGAVSAGLVFILVGVVIYGVVMRYVFRSPTAWSIELPELMFIAILSFCIGYAGLHGRHIRITLVTSRLPGKAQNALDILASVVTTGYCVLVVWALWNKFMVHLTLKEMTYESHILYAPFSLAIVIGVSLLGLNIILDRQWIRKQGGERDDFKAGTK